jgi:hypothetical protein
MVELYCSLSSHTIILQRLQPWKYIRRKHILKCASVWKDLKKKLHGLSPRANYTDRATATCRRSDCQLLRIQGATWAA